MANLNIAIQIAAKDKGATGVIGRIKDSLGDLGDTTRRGFSGLQTVVGGAMLGTGTAAIGALAGVGGAAFGMANDVQTATSAIQAQLGVTGEEAERLGQIALDVFGDNFAGNVGEASQAVALVRQQLGDMADDELQRAAENAFRLNDTFGVETPESINAAKTLMEDFGLTSDQAFDFIASGFQKGLDRSGDFLDTIGEYSTQFANGGADAGQFFSLIESGLQGGMLGTDKAADAFKEFRVRIQDGSKTTSDALSQLGIDANDLAEQMATGQVTAADAFQIVLDKLRNVDDENIRMQAGVGLLGTQFEDLGTDAALALSTVGTNIEDLEGAADSLDAKYNTLGSIIEGFKRRALVAIEPIGSILLDIANIAMPLVEQGFALFETSIVPKIETAAGVVKSFINNFQEGMSPLDSFIEAIWDIAPQEVLDSLVSLRDDILPGLSNWFTDNVQPVIDMVTQFVTWQDVLIALGVIIASTVLPVLWGIVTAAAPVIAVGAALIGAIALARNAWENDWGGIRTAVEGAIAYLEPYWERLKATLNQFWQEIIPALQEVWQTIVDVWKTELQPAIADLWAVFQDLFAELGFGKGETDFLAAALGFLKLALDGIVLVVHFLSPIIRIWADNVSYALGFVTKFVEGLTSMKNAAEKILSPLQDVADKIGDMISKMLEMPDWMIPHSPTPFELGLRGIGSAIKAMPELKLSTPSLALPHSLWPGGGNTLAAASAGGGGITIGSITIQAGSYEGGKEAGRGFVDELRSRGLL